MSLSIRGEDSKGDLDLKYETDQSSKYDKVIEWESVHGLIFTERVFTYLTSNIDNTASSLLNCFG